MSSPYPGSLVLNAQPGRGEARPPTCPGTTFPSWPGTTSARDQDRDQAIEIVEAAWADGQIVEADRDKRVESLLQAQTMAEVQDTVHDLQRRGRHRRRRRTASRRSRWTRLSRRRGRSAPAATGLWLLLLLIPIGLVAGVIAIIAAIVSGVSTAIDEDDLATEPGVEPGRGEVNVMSVDGLADLVAAIEEETGSSTVFEAVPTRGTPSSTSRSTPRRTGSTLLLGRRPRGDRQQEHDRLPALRPRRRRCERGRLHRRPGAGEGGGPAVVVLDHPRAPSEHDDGTWIWGYASNEYGESGYLGGDKAGTITWDPDKPPRSPPDSGDSSPGFGPARIRRSPVIGR